MMIKFLNPAMTGRPDPCAHPVGVLLQGRIFDHLELALFCAFSGIFLAPGSVPRGRIRGGRIRGRESHWFRRKTPVPLAPAACRPATGIRQQYPMLPEPHPGPLVSPGLGEIRSRSMSSPSSRLTRRTRPPRLPQRNRPDRSERSRIPGPVHPGWSVGSSRSRGRGTTGRPRSAERTGVPARLHARSRTWVGSDQCRGMPPTPRGCPRRRPPRIPARTGRNGGNRSPGRRPERSRQSRPVDCVVVVAWSSEAVKRRYSSRYPRHSPGRSWLRPHPGVSQEKLPIYLGICHSIESHCDIGHDNSKY